MHFVAAVAAVLGMAASAQAHMEMIEPAPLRQPGASFTTNPDYNLNAPLNPTQNLTVVMEGDFPCRGAIGDVGTAQGLPVTQWPTGSSQVFKIGGGARHGGGSCQASLSYDKGETWTVMKSWVGGCPREGKKPYEFDVPGDAPTGEAVFAWTWFNKLGVREMYMNCAVVTITAGPGGGAPVGTPFSSRPAMFVANVNHPSANGCTTEESTDLQFPNPGPDVVTEPGTFAPPICPGGVSQQPPRPALPPTSSSAPDAPPPPPPPAASKSAAPAPVPAPSGINPAPVAPRPPSPPPPPPPAASKSPAAVPAPGGIFIATSVADPDTVPTTIQTVVRPTQSAPAAAAAPPPAAAAPPPAGGFPAWSPCSELGDWNCIGGIEFQRCGSGNMWSPVQGLAAGTACKAGVDKNIIFI